MNGQDAGAVLAKLSVASISSELLQQLLQHLRQGRFCGRGTRPQKLLQV